MFECRIVITSSSEWFALKVVIRLVETGNRIVKMWYVKSGGGLAPAPKKKEYICPEKLQKKKKTQGMR